LAVTRRRFLLGHSFAAAAAAAAEMRDLSGREAKKTLEIG
jgi:hypothetical protein